MAFRAARASTHAALGGVQAASAWSLSSSVVAFSPVSWSAVSAVSAGSVASAASSPVSAASAGSAVSQVSACWATVVVAVVVVVVVVLVNGSEVETLGRKLKMGIGVAVARR